MFDFSANDHRLAGARGDILHKKKSGKADQKKKANQGVNHGRHEYHCKICSHAERADVEEAFIDWVSPGQITKQYGVSRDSVYRHAHALGLMDRRRRNVRSALERFLDGVTCRLSYSQKVPGMRMYGPHYLVREPS